MKGNKRKKTDAMGSVETEEDGKRRSRGKVQAEMERKLWAEETGGGKRCRKRGTRLRSRNARH